MKKGIIQKYIELGYEKHSGFLSSELDQKSIRSKYKQIEYFLIQKWIREEKMLFLSILMNIETLNFSWEIWDIKNKIGHEYNTSSDKWDFKTYEQALEDCLREALKLIK